MIRKSKDPENLDAHTDADWSGQSKGYLGWSAQGRVSNIARVHEGSELSNVIERRKRVLRCGDDDGAPRKNPGILGNVGQAPIANRFNDSTRHHPTTGVRSSQTHRNETLVASSETRGEKVDGGQGTDSKEHSRWIDESIAVSEVLGMVEPSQYGLRQR